MSTSLSNARQATDQKGPAFHDGYGAFKFGEPLSNCPCVADTAVSSEWRMGWITARDDAWSPGGRKG